ncbi:MAG: ATP-binding protein [Myxococcales bacterium]|nr:ATP-binding protein [Myxococcales bacterium]
MELVVRNLGRIREASVELRPLTVLVGPNHTNKTWLGIAAYTALRETGFPEEGTSPDLDGEAWAPLARALSATGHQTIAVDLGKLVTTPSVTWQAHRPQLTHALGSDPGESTTCELRVDRSSLFLPADAELTFDPSSRSVTLEAMDAAGPPVRFTGSVSPDRALRFARWACRMMMAEGLVSSTVPFPVDRVASLPPGGAPGIAREHHRMVEGWRAQSPLDAPLERAADRVSSRILGGRVRMTASADRFRYGDAGIDLPVAASASLVRSLASLQLYLTTAARPGDFVLIDEPEMNAHPRAQLAIAELLACMVRWGLQVMITTHSPYLVDHLTNLMAAAALPSERARGLDDQLQLRTLDALLPADSVAAYAFEEQDDGSVEVVDIVDREEGVILNDTFGRETERLQDLYAQIIKRSR